MRSFSGSLGDAAREVLDMRCGTPGMTPRAPAPTPSAEEEKPIEERAAETDLRQLPVLRHFEERRSYPRIELRGTAILVTENHQVLKMRTRNLSADGVQLRSDHATALKLHPRGSHIPPGTGPKFSLRLSLPICGEVQPVVIDARLDYIAARSSDEIAFGAKFLYIRPADKKTLADFIMESMRPA